MKKAKSLDELSIPDKHREFLESFLKEVWRIKEEKSQLTKKKTADQLITYYANSLMEFNRVMGNPLGNTHEEYIHNDSAVSLLTN